MRGQAIAVIISIAQQARPKPSGQSAFLRAQFCAFSSVVRSSRVLDVLLDRRVVEVAAQHLLGVQLAGSAGRSSLPSFWRVTSIRALLFSRRSTKATSSSAMKTIVSTSANVADRLELDGDRVEEDHLDVEQDEEHRDQVEADPEAEALATSEGSPHS